MIEIVGWIVGWIIAIALGVYQIWHGHGIKRQLREIAKKSVNTYYGVHQVVNTIENQTIIESSNIAISQAVQDDFYTKYIPTASPSGVMLNNLRSLFTHVSVSTVSPSTESAWGGQPKDDKEVDGEKEGE